MLRKLLVCVMVLSTLFAFASINASAESSFDDVIEATVTQINNEKLVGDYSFVMHLSNTDYMTAEWDQTNYRWFNVEPGTDYESVDLNEYNLCNFPIDKNLEEYNFEQKVLIDGVTLAEYKIEHPYTLMGNMRTRVDTLSINFETPVLKDVSVVEILEGCQFPTLARGCRNSVITSCIEITESVKYENRNGIWVLYFAGYEENVEYNGDEKMFYLSTSSTYKTHHAVPLTEYTDFFDGRNVAGDVYYGKALASTGNTQKNYVVVLKLTNPVNAEEFNQINLRLYTNHKRTVFTHSDSQATDSSLGTILESFTLNGGSYTTVGLTSELYADADGFVRTIVFRFNEDGEPFVDANGNEHYDANGNLERDQLFFISMSVSNRDVSELLTKDSFMIIDNGDVYDLILRFNKSGENLGIELDKSKVMLNGQTLAKVLAECKTATAQWSTLGSIYQIYVTLPKSYNGTSQIKNVDNGLSGNSMGVIKGLTFPDGTVLDQTYTCRVYATEKFLDSEMDFEHDKVTVLGISYEFVPGSDNVHFALRFDKNITTASYYHACETEHWRQTDLVASNPLYYDRGMSNVFVKNGYKSSLLDSIVINGKSIGDWHAQEPTAATNIQTHFGQSGFQYVDVHFESHIKSTYDPIANLVKSGNGITIEIREGLKFMTNCKVKQTQTFVLKDGVFVEQVKGQSLHVYYDGSEVQNGDSVTVKTAVCPSSILVTGVYDYQVTHVTNGKVTEFTIVYENGEEFKFSVTEDSVQTESEQQSSNGGKGCKSVVELPALCLLLALAVVIVTLKGRRVHE